MKMLTDLLPVIAFVVIYQLYDIYIATAALMVLLIAQIAFFKLTGKPVEKVHWITLWLVLFFGTLTLVLHDPVFIMWKPTVINWAFAAALLVSHWFMKRGLIARMLDAVASFPDLIIQRLTYAWTFFLIGLGALNLYVAFNFDEATWVNFKLFGLMGLTLVFALGQGLYLARHMPENQQS